MSISFCFPPVGLLVAVLFRLICWHEIPLDEVINCVRVVTQVPRYFKSGRDAPLDALGISTVLIILELNIFLRLGWI